MSDKTNSISAGTTATLIINKEEVTYTFTDKPESDYSQGTVSLASPMGEALLGKSEGDVVEIERDTGNLTVTVFEVHDREE